MNTISRDIFKAIHEGKLLSIEYKNKDEKITKYWIEIKNINPKSKVLRVDGFHLAQHTICELNIHLESILSSSVIDGSYCKVNQTLISDIQINPQKYSEIFSNIANLKILNYLADCYKLDTTPYKKEYSLITQFDEDRFSNGIYTLSDEQFIELIKAFQSRTNKNKESVYRKFNYLALNVLSIRTKKDELYVLAYRKLNLDVKSRCLVQSPVITICKEFSIYGEKQSVRQFLDAEDYELLNDIENNLEIIKDKITRQNKYINGVDDMPYILTIGMDCMLDLEVEYKAVLDMYESGKVTVPIKAFFGDLVRRPDRRKDYPIALINKKVNIDQLLAIHNAVKYPLAYIQGPPGTGKTNTIINTVTTAFFNEKTILLASYNNHPIDGVFETLKNIKYKNDVIPFPIIRLGNDEKVEKALDYIKNIFQKTKSLKIYDKTLTKNKGNKIEETKKLTELLKRHEDILDLRERKESVESLISSSKHLDFQVELHGKQLTNVERDLKNIGEVTDDEALKLLPESEDEFLKYLYYTSAKYIQRLGETKNEELLKIVNLEDRKQAVAEFNKYLKKEENVKKLLKIFPVVATTCISAHKIGEPKQYFDMVIMDEASQCNTAVSLVPIIRGESLMLVGDPQQLSPVILLDTKDNSILRRNYLVSDEYDYIQNSIYKVFLACDSVSEEILLSYHYRCQQKIIQFNNKKYYNNKLNIMTKDLPPPHQPLAFCEISDSKPVEKNTSMGEVEAIISYIRENRDKKVGVITPFTKQKELINKILENENINDVTCGTVHAFQGDEKDTILFSLAVTDNTHKKTYDWLKNNKELINVAVSRAKEKLILYSNMKNLKRLNNLAPHDDFYELVEYVRTNGETNITEKITSSRALGIKPYSTKTEDAFLTNLNHALDNILYNNRKCVIHKEVAISHVFQNNITYSDLFYSGRFDFVVYEKSASHEIPIFAIELDGKEHFEDEVVKERDRKKNEICREHGFELIRIENSYARRYNYVKDILIEYFS